MRGFLFFASYHLPGANRREAEPLDVLRQTRYNKGTDTPYGIEVFFMKQCMDADNLHRRLKKIIG